jgi:hypothetical protein
LTLPLRLNFSVGNRNVFDYPCCALSDDQTVLPLPPVSVETSSVGESSKQLARGGLFVEASSIDSGARFNDLTGRRFGSLVALKVRTHNTSRYVQWLCKCDCGRERAVQSCYLVKGTITTCGKDLCRRTEKEKRIPAFFGLYLYLKRSGEKRNMEVTLTFEEFLEFTAIKNCHYCAAAIFWRRSGRVAYNLDRMNPMLPYLKSNLVVCCPRCNYAKGHYFTYEEWVEVGKVISGFKRAGARLRRGQLPLSI